MSRIGAAKTDESNDEDISKSEKAYNAIGIAIRKSATEFRSYSDVMTDLSAKWQTLTEVQRSNIAEVSAGKICPIIQ